jgi:hypothetical protein
MILELIKLNLSKWQKAVLTEKIDPICIGHSTEIIYRDYLSQ